LPGVDAAVLFDCGSEVCAPTDVAVLTTTL